MKALKLFAAAMFSLTLLSCESVVDVPEKPSSNERSVDFKILLKDKTGNMEKLFGSDNVPGVTVTIKSVTLGTEYSIKSDENGVVTLSDVVSDKYNISAIRSMSKDEMEVITGQKLDFYKLMNSNIGIVDLSADIKDTVTIYLDNLIKQSPLVISEVYACGPPGAGLYIHDRYCEIYNQSDEVAYLDGLIIADIWSNPKMGINYIDDPLYIHSRKVWKFPGKGGEYPIQPGQYIVCAADAIDHTVNAPQSVDLSKADFEFYKDDAPDVDNPAVPNMIKLYQAVSEIDWTINGESGALCLIQMDEDSIGWYDNHMILPYSAILDGMEYIDDLTDVQYKRLNSVIDASFTGGIEFYTGKSMERVVTQRDDGKYILKDDNNSMLDFTVLSHPTPGYHYQLTNSKRR
jgi:hypothetical protein